LSVDSRLRRRCSNHPELVGFFRRVLQIHLCAVYFFSGTTKAVAAEWWNGTSVWRALVSPPFDLISPSMLISYHYLLPLLGIGVCLLEISYPIFIWPKNTRLIWLTLIIMMHLG